MRCDRNEFSQPSDGIVSGADRKRHRCSSPAAATSAPDRQKLFDEFDQLQQDDDDDRPVTPQPHPCRFAFAMLRDGLAVFDG